MNNNFDLREYLFHDRPGDEPGQRAEAIVTMTLGFLSTSLAILAYRDPIVLLLSVITNVVAVFTLIQALRGRYNFLIYFPAVTAVSICAVSIIEGDGVHDLIWIGNLGLFLLANVYSRKNDFPAIIVGAFMTLLFFGAGLAEVYNVLPNPFGTAFEYVVLNSFFFIMIMSAMVAVFNRQRTLRNLAAATQKELIAANQLLEESNRGLESQVNTRTTELKELNKQLQTKAGRLQAISDISQEILDFIVDKPNELLTHAAKLISSRLGYYHVGIFMLDQSREYAMLRAANSRGGQQMLARRHQLRVGGAGIVGYVAQTGKPRIALDTSSDAVFFNNPDLPETHSEISLPLKFGNMVIGVLDVQSTHPSAFNEDDIDTLSTLANQIAIVLRNLEIEEENRFISTTGKKFTRAEREKGFTYQPEGGIVSSSSLPEKNPAVAKALVSGETIVLNSTVKGTSPTLAVPVKLRDQVIGIIHIQSREENRNWTDDEVALVLAVSDRAGLALDNARLLEETERRAAKEHVISEISTRIGAATDVETILRTAVSELGAQISGAQVTVEIGGGED